MKREHEKKVCSGVSRSLTQNRAIANFRVVHSSYKGTLTRSKESFKSLILQPRTRRRNVCNNNAFDLRAVAGIPKRLSSVASVPDPRTRLRLRNGPEQLLGHNVCQVTYSRNPSSRSIRNFPPSVAPLPLSPCLCIFSNCYATPRRVHI